jgi:protocatechuate 3,4-dioxygenase beta subunit
VLALACAAAAVAGTTGGIGGRVVDDHGRPLAGACVTLYGPAGRYETTSDARGHYQILSINPDMYNVNGGGPVICHGVPSRSTSRRTG